MADVHANQDRLVRAFSSRETEPASRLGKVRHRFLAQLPQRGREISDWAEEIHQCGLKTNAVAGITNHAHRIAGVAATLGFPALGSAAMAVDSCTSNRATRDTLLENVDVLLDEIDRINAAGF